MNLHNLIVLVGQVYYWVAVGLAIRGAIREAATIFREIKSHWGAVKEFTMKIVNWMRKALRKSIPASK